MNKIFWEYFLDDSVFKIGTYPEIYRQNSRKTTSKKFIFKVGSSILSTKILKKYLRKKLYFRKLLCIYEQNLWNIPVNEFFFSVYHIPGYICDCS